MNSYRSDRVLVTDRVLVPLPYIFIIELTVYNDEYSIYPQSDTDAVTTTEAPPVRVKRVGRGDGARCLCFFLVALARENDSSHFSSFLLRNNSFFRYFGKNLPKICI